MEKKYSLKKKENRLVSKSKTANRRKNWQPGTPGDIYQNRKSLDGIGRLPAAPGESAGLQKCGKLCGYINQTFVYLI